MGLWRIQVSPRRGLPDPAGRRTCRLLADFGISGVTAVHSARIFDIQLADGAAEGERRLVDRMARELFCDPVAEAATIIGPGEAIGEVGSGLAVEIYLKPGVMDPVAQTARLALADMGIESAGVQTARRYEVEPAPSDADLARACRLMGNPCIEVIVVGGRSPASAPAPRRYVFQLRRVALRGLTDAELDSLSASGHLFLSPAEMKAIQGHYRKLDRDPTDLELETIAQTWSEHCVHKTLKSAVDYRGLSMPSLLGVAAEDGAETIELAFDNLLKDTIVRATKELAAEGRGPQCLSVFVDNAGVIGFDDDYGIAFKVETHNHPSAIEPYGGAATGVGGVIRDVLGCGLGAKPVANTDVFCVAPPDWPVNAVPRGIIHPRNILKGVVSGVRDYGNRMGIPTVNGAVHFDSRYLGNPLVFCGCVGLLPRNRLRKAARPGDLIVVMGGRTGRDGIHGATFSSAELTRTHEDEFAHAVQIGNAIEEKKVHDAVLRAREFAGPDGARQCLFSAITDCGAGGLSSAVGEMAQHTGAAVDLDKVPLKYEGLRYDEIWISESQERMVLAVPAGDLGDLTAVAGLEDVEATVIGRFTDNGRLVLRYEGHVVGDIDLAFLHNGVPKTRRQAEWQGPPIAPKSAVHGRDSDNLPELQRRLSDPIVASKHWIIHQYDHEVQSGAAVKPLTGRGGGPSDAAVVRPRLGSHRGVAIGCGLAPDLGDVDPYWMAVAAIDEALRNVVAVGGDPGATAILDNFCWPRVDRPDSMGALVRTCQACYDVAKAYGVPFISGKDSLNNEFALAADDAAMVRDILAARGGPPMPGDRLAIPYTLLISAISIVEDVNRTVTADLKSPGGDVYLIGRPSTWNGNGDGPLPRFDARIAERTHRFVAELIRDGIVTAVHDVSDGGLLVALAEMCIGGNLGAEIVANPSALGIEVGDYFFHPFPAAYLVEVEPDRRDDFAGRASGDVHSTRVARVDDSSGAATPMLRLSARDGSAAGEISIEELGRTWRGPLDW